MLKELFTELFNALMLERENDTKSKHGCATFFVEKILEERFKKSSYKNSRTIINYYEKYVEGKENTAGEPSNELKNYIARYLEYENFLDFENKNTPDPLTPTPNRKPSSGLMKIVAVVIVLILSALGLYYSNKTVNNSECLKWQGDHYVKIKCGDKDPDPMLKDVNIETFRKVRVSDTTTFFIEGHPVIWYGKSHSGEMEYFNSRGPHPETKEELKPITEYIIRKYIFTD